MIGESSYNPIKGVLTLKNISFSTSDTSDDGTLLFSLDLLQIDIDIKKTVTLNPTISEVRLKAPSTYLIRDEKTNSFTIPAYLPKKEGKTSKISLLNLPISFEDITLSGGTLSLQEDDKKKPLLTEIEIIIPGARLTKGANIEPVIRGIFKKKPFEFSGQTTIHEDRIENNFTLSFKKLNIKEFSQYIPDIKKVKPVFGILSSDVSLLFTIFTDNKKPSLLITGDAQCYNLSLKDLNNNTLFLRNSYAKVKSFKFDVFARSISLDSLYLSNGTLTLSRTVKQDTSSVFFLKDKKARKPYSYLLKAVTTKKLTVNYFDERIKSKFRATNVNTTIGNFATGTRSAFSLSALMDKSSINAAGSFYLKERSVNFTRLKLTQFDIHNIKVLKERIGWLTSAVISAFDGNMSIKPGFFEFGGTIIGSNVRIDFPESKRHLLVESIQVGIPQYNTRDNRLPITSIRIKDGALFNGQKSLFKNLDMNLSSPVDSKAIEIVRDEKLLDFVIRNDLNIDDLTLTMNDSKGKPFFFSGKRVNIIPDIQISALPAFKVTGEAFIDTGLLSFGDRTTNLMNIESSSIKVDSVKLMPLQLNIGSVELVKPYFTITRGITNSLMFLNFIPIQGSSEDSPEKKHEINLEEAVMKSGTCLFTDYSMDKTYTLTLSSLDASLLHYPSELYPRGTLTLMGVINNRNRLSLVTEMSKKTGISGTISSTDISLPSFSTYTEHFLHHSVQSGIMDLDAHFSYHNKNFSLKLDSVLTGPILVKDRSFKRIQDLSVYIGLLEDENGRIMLDLPPVTGVWGDPKIDFMKIFFDLLLTRISNTGKLILESFNNFRADDHIEILYFKPGTSEFIRNDMSGLLSARFKKRVTDPGVRITIEGYIDRKTDFKGSVSENDYYALSYARIMAAKKFLSSEFGIDPKHIGISEHSIFENPYVSGISNSIVVVKTGKVSPRNN